MTIQTISTLPDAPTPADSPTEFATKAAAFVPALNPFGVELNQFGVDVVSEATAVIESAQDSLNITAQGLFDAIVVGDTDGVNKEFDILNASFYPYWMLFQDGVKIPLDEITMSGTTATLVTAPTSGAKMEAIAPRSIDFIAPDGFKTIAFISDKNGTIEISCDVSGSVLPQWKVGGVTTESESFSYVNAGEYICIYLYVPDNSYATVDAEAQDIYLIDIQNNTDSVSLIKLGSNSNFSYYESLGNLTSLTSFHSAFSYNNLASIPLINTSNVTSFYYAFRNNNLTSIPLLDTSSATNFYSTFRNNNLTSIPLLDTSNVKNFYSAFMNNNLTSFPKLDYSSGTDFSNTWTGNALTESAVNQILEDLDSYGISNCAIGLDGGTNASPAGAGLTAKASLESRGCTVNVN